MTLMEQCLSLPPMERLRLGHILVKSCHFGKNDNASRAEQIVRTACKVFGVDELPANKTLAGCLARDIVAYQMHTENYSQEMIGRYVNRDRTSVSCMIRKMKEMLYVPSSYVWELRHWEEFKQQLEYETDTTTI